jgi:hypothetical protein
MKTIIYNGPFEEVALGTPGGGDLVCKLGGTLTVRDDVADELVAAAAQPGAHQWQLTDTKEN